jgi:hypothetical protein
MIVFPIFTLTVCSWAGLRAVITNYHGLGGLETTDIERFKSWISGRGSQKGLLPDSTLPTYCCTFTVERERALWGPFDKGCNPIYKDLILMTTQRFCLLMPPHWGLGFQHLDGGGGKHNHSVPKIMGLNQILSGSFWLPQLLAQSLEYSSCQ